MLVVYTAGVAPGSRRVDGCCRAFIGIGEKRAGCVEMSKTPPDQDLGWRKPRAVFPIFNRTVPYQQHNFPRYYPLFSKSSKLLRVDLPKRTEILHRDGHGLGRGLTFAKNPFSFFPPMENSLLSSFHLSPSRDSRLPFFNQSLCT